MAIPQSYAKAEAAANSIADSHREFASLNGIGQAARDTSAAMSNSANGIHLQRMGITPAEERRISSATTFLTDGRRLIDFVLAYQPKESQSPQSKRNLQARYREEFEKKLSAQGLELEWEGIDQSQDGKTCFVKIHAPFDVLTRTAEINRLKMPIKIDDLPSEENFDFIDKIFKRFNRRNPFRSEQSSSEEPKYFTAAFIRARLSQFIMKDKETFFSGTQRIRLVYDILLRTQVRMLQSATTSPIKSNTSTAALSNVDTIGNFVNEAKQPEPVGINWLLKEKVYVAAFPLHDGNVEDDEDADKFQQNTVRLRSVSGTLYKYSFIQLSSQQFSVRQLLCRIWSAPRMCLKYQPLHKVRDYFGEKIAFYFAWLGFYTRMLILPAIVGLVCFVYGLTSTSVDVPRNDICENPRVSNITMCRLCYSTVCPFRQLKASCLYSTLTIVFDNTSTVVFSLFMSIWAVVFLELWKRHEAELRWNWDVSDSELVEDSIRPEYQAAVKTQRVNPITQEMEPYLPMRDKFHRLMASVATVLFMVFVVLGILAGITFYRIVGIGLYYKASKDPLLEHVTAPVLTSVTAAIFNAICILVLEKLYEQLARYLTNREYPKTQKEFESSYTYKVFVFQFINYYVALFYIAFLKGKIYGPPTATNYSDRCDPAGCLIDVCIQLAIIMVGKQVINNCAEIGFPVIRNWWRRRNNIKETADNLYTRWEKDFDLNPLPDLGLFDEYLEMIIQYGFVTMFVAAFPLAPLFALLNNIIEIRLDSYKLTTQFRRPVPLQAHNIGAWSTILEIITKIAVITNGLVIAFTSDFIDRMVYVYTVSPDYSLQGYTEHLFSEFQTSEWSNELRKDAKLGNVSVCYYKDYRQSAKPYNRSDVWWHVLVARLVFVLIFEHVVFLIQSIVEYLIPDVPEHVNVKIQRENYLAKQAMYNYEFDQKRQDSSNLSETGRSKQSMDAMTNGKETEITLTRRQTANAAIISPSPTIYV